MKRKIAALVCAFAVVCTSWGTGGISQVEAAPREKAVGTTYYFSSEGDNANDGTSEKEAWQSLEMLKNVELQCFLRKVWEMYISFMVYLKVVASQCKQTV